MCKHAFLEYEVIKMAKPLFPYSGPKTTLGRISERLTEIEDFTGFNESGNKPSTEASIDFSKLSEKQIEDLKKILGIK